MPTHDSSRVDRSLQTYRSVQSLGKSQATNSRQTSKSISSLDTSQSSIVRRLAENGLFIGCVHRKICSWLNHTCTSQSYNRSSHLNISRHSGRSCNDDELTVRMSDTWHHERANAYIWQEQAVYNLWVIAVLKLASCAFPPECLQAAIHDSAPRQIRR